MTKDLTTKPKRDRNRAPVSSFGPELMALLMRGAKEEVFIPLLNPSEKGMLRKLQHRLNTLRSSMFKENHPDYAIAIKCSTSLNDTGLYLRPADSQFASLLSHSTSAPPRTTAPLPSSDPLDSLPEEE